jgi:hypothetical protein
MKTSTFSLRNTSIYYIVGFLSILLTSCGSYRNSSYYDRDGIYGNTESRIIPSEPHVSSNNRYKDYFSSLQNENQSTEIFTDIDSYNDYNLENDTLQDYNSNYPGWGSNPQSVSINVYNTGWGMNNWYGNNWYGNNWYGNNWGFNGGIPQGLSIGFGWNNYGWNYPYYGWGWGYPSYGWNYSNYAYGGYGYYSGNNYSYNSSRRGSEYNSNLSNTRNNSDRIGIDSYPENQVKSSRDGNYRRSNYNNQHTIPATTRPNYQNQNNSTYSPNRRENQENSSSDNNVPSRTYRPNTRSDSNPSTRSNNSNYSPNRRENQENSSSENNVPSRTYRPNTRSDSNPSSRSNNSDYSPNRRENQENSSSENNVPSRTYTPNTRSDSNPSSQSNGSSSYGGGRSAGSSGRRM